MGEESGTFSTWEPTRQTRRGDIIDTITFEMRAIEDPQQALKDS